MTKYFIIGLNKTGTTSIRSALGASLQVTSILKIVPKKNICKFNGIEDIFSFTDSLIKKYKLTIFKDRPWNTGCYKELNEKYNDSKFILTIRDQEKWWTSVKNWLSLKTKWGINLKEKNKIKVLNNKIEAYNRHFNCNSLNKNCYMNYYNSYNNAVIEYFKDKSNLYILDLHKDFNWLNIQKIVNLDEETMIKNIKKSIGKKKYLPDGFNGKINDLQLKDFKFLIANKNVLI